MGYHLHDETLQFRVEMFLKSRHFPDFEKLNVHVENGAVCLSGELNSYYEKQVAINSCRRVAGVGHLVDQIAVSVKSMETTMDQGLLNAS